MKSCLVEMAAIMEVSIDNIEVKVETEFDARCKFGLEDRSSGYDAIKYAVHIERNASDEKVQEVIEGADERSPVLDDFRRPIPVEREVNIIKS